MKYLLITIAAVLMVGCGNSRTQESINRPVQLKEFIVNKKVYFNLKSDLNAKFWCVFDDEGNTRHSARTDGKYHVEELEIKVKDVENVRLVFNNHEISEGDTFKAYSNNQSSALEFTINKIEELEAGEERNIEDLTVIMRVNPTSSDEVGHTRTEFDVGDISNLYFYSSGAFSFDEIRIGKTYESVTSNEPRTSNDIIFYEGFDYESTTQLANQDGWYKGGRISRRSDNYSIQKGSLTYNDISSYGNRAYAESSEIMSGISRRIPQNLLENNNGKIFVSFMLQPEVKLHEGIYEGYFVLSLGTNKGKEINFGKGGESKIATKEHYVSELEGGLKRVSSGVKCEIEKTAFILLEIES